VARGNRKKPNPTGRDDKRTGSQEAVIILRRSFWLTPQVSALSPNARALLIELTAMYTGPKCHGRLFLSVRDAARRLGLSDLAAAGTAIDELLDLGFLVETVPSHFAMKAGGKSRARGFRLNWKDEDGRPVGDSTLPDLDYGKLSKRQKLRVERRAHALADYAKTNSTVLETRTMADIRADFADVSVRVTNTLTAENGSFAFPTNVRESSTHIYYQGGAGAAVLKPHFRRATLFQSKRPRGLTTAMHRRHRPGRRHRPLAARLRRSA
jgi:hypothetical protein